MRRRALITGIAGQDGMYLTELLHDKGYDVFGLLGPDPGSFCEWSARFGGSVRGLSGDLGDMRGLMDVVEESAPDEIYNLAAMSSVGDSWENAVAMTDVNATGVLRLLETVRTVAPKARFFQASSAEIFGRATGGLQNESTPLHPCSQYAAAKAYGFFITVNYRESRGIHANNGILFNHESPRRGIQFVTRKITNAAARISLGLEKSVALGNLDSRRDWGFAGDYVRAMWLTLQQDEPGDYVVATGETHSVRELCDVAFSHVGLDYRGHVTVDERFLRPADVDVLQGDSSKARRVLGWEPVVGFKELVTGMVDHDLAANVPMADGDAACPG